MFAVVFHILIVSFSLIGLIQAPYTWNRLFFSIHFLLSATSSSTAKLAPRGLYPVEPIASQDNLMPHQAQSSQNSMERKLAPNVLGIMAVRYVSADGSDMNDGLTMKTAKRTVYGALISLPGGSKNAAGSGTVYVSSTSLSNPALGAGIWIFGPNDPNYLRPPIGWLQCNGCSISIIGVGDSGGGPNGHKPRAQLIAGGNASRNHPGIWISGTNNPIYIANFEIQYPARPVVIGECSNNDRTGKCGVQSLILDNVSSQVLQNASNGPCTDIVSNVFWVWLRDYGCSGNAYSAKGAPRSDNSAAILIDGSGGMGSGMIYITDANLAGGGIKVKSGANGAGLYARNVIQEGNFVNALPPTVWFTGWCNSSNCDSILDNIQMADNVGAPTVIEVDGAIGPGPTVLNSSYISGPAVVINPDVAAVSTISPLWQRQVGFFNNYVVGQSDVARRISGLVPARFANKANTNSVFWKYTNYAGTQSLRHGLSDPFGGTGAASVSSSSPHQENLSLGSCTEYTPNAGDWLIVGVWGIGMSPNTQTISASCYGYPFPKVKSTYINSGRESGDGQWQYQWQAYKVEGGTATMVGTNVVFSDKLKPTLYGPSLYIIPAGKLSDNEVLEFASTMNSIDSRCQVGQICNVGGHQVVASSYGTLANCSSTVAPAKCDSAPAGSLVLRAGSTSVTVNTTAVTSNSQILIMEDSTIGTKLGVSCNKHLGRTYMITSRSAGISFTVTSSFAPEEDPACLSFQILN
jgi:hypothetical protein